jgi:hypothetical protein
MYKITVTMPGEVGTNVVTRTGFSRDEKEAIYFSSKEQAEKEARYIAHGLPHFWFQVCSFDDKYYKTVK